MAGVLALLCGGGGAVFRHLCHAGKRLNPPPCPSHILPFLHSVYCGDKSSRGQGRRRHILRSHRPGSAIHPTRLGSRCHMLLQQMRKPHCLHLRFRRSPRPQCEPPLASPPILGRLLKMENGSSPRRHASCKEARFPLPLSPVRISCKKPLTGEAGMCYHKERRDGCAGVVQW